jgi:hypothetical protein
MTNVMLMAVQDFQSLKRNHGMGEMRTVVLEKGPEEGLGMSITVSSRTLSCAAELLDFELSKKICRCVVRCKLASLT